MTMTVITTFRRASTDEMAREIDRCHAIIERYEAEMASKNKVLEFYAHRPHYAARTGMESAITRDNFGDRARAILSALYHSPAQAVAEGDA
jgi:exonuclease I